MDQIQCNADFADYLVAAGACQQDLADKMSKRAKSSWSPLGMLLINTGVLRMKDVAKILSVQAESPKRLFGDVAVELGLCTEPDIQEAIQVQARECPHVLDLAFESDEVDQVLLISAVKMYVRQTERVLDRLNDALLETSTS